ncbi:MAG: flagellar protein FlaG [Spongiibacteraceae bacterium]|nr:flagellar protein FlaG [Spongiibacteraceae bacterium]
MLNDIVNNGFQVSAQTKETKATASAVFPKPEDMEPKEQSDKQVKPADPVELQSAVTKLNDYVQNIQRTLAFTVEEKTGITVVQVYDTETEELIRQIPAEETIKLAASIEAHTASLFLKEQA